MTYFGPVQGDGDVEKPQRRTTSWREESRPNTKADGTGRPDGHGGVIPRGYRPAEGERGEITNASENKMSTSRVTKVYDLP